MNEMSEKKFDICKTNAKKICDVVLGSDFKTPLDLIYCANFNPKNFKNSSTSYAIVMDGEVVKIGGSDCKAGIKATLGFYKDGLSKGNPGKNRHAIAYLLKKNLKKASKIEIWAIFGDPQLTMIRGFYEGLQVLAPPASKLLETQCKEEFKQVTGHYPVWNLKENSKSYPLEIQESYLKFETSRINKIDKKKFTTANS